jgi:hypothetical protein
MKLMSRKYWSDVFDPAMIVKTTLQTIIGSILIGSFFMILSDYVLKPIDMNGRWDLTLKPKTALGKNNQCVDITYSVLFVQEGLEITGFGEKWKDRKSSNQKCKDHDIFERTVDPGKGRKIIISGFIHTNYIVNDLLSLSYKEGNEKNTRFTIASFKIKADNKIRGWYKSSISRAEGVIVLSKVK